MHMLYEMYNTQADRLVTICNAMSAKVFEARQWTHSTAIADQRDGAVFLAMRTWNFARAQGLILDASAYTELFAFACEFSAEAGQPAELLSYIAHLPTLLAVDVAALAVQFLEKWVAHADRATVAELVCPVLLTLNRSQVSRIPHTLLQSLVNKIMAEKPVFVKIKLPLRDPITMPLYSAEIVPLV